MFVKCFKSIFGCYSSDERRLERQLERYQKLPATTPEFENAAVRMAGENLSKDEMENMADMFNVHAFARTIIRASVFSGKIPTLSLSDPLAAFRNLAYELECKNLQTEFMKLSVADKLAIVDHFDSEISPIKSGGVTTGYRLTPKATPDGEAPRKFIPEPTNISIQARNWYNKCDALVLEGSKMDHPIMKIAAKVTFPKNE
jgi:hypothetical protein